MKTLGTGWRKGVRWRDIQVIHNNDGKPEVRLVGKTKEIAKRLEIDEVLVSMSHTKEYAIAQAIAVSK
ncbi:Holo-[acyl-carrier-protein] synthase [subsurface metagenome]